MTVRSRTTASRGLCALLLATVLLLGGGSPASADTGKVLIVCPPSHMAMDDPLIKFGQFGASHMHVFAGSTIVDADTTLPEMLAGPTTCQVHSDHSAFWFPAVEKNGQTLMPTFSSYYLITWDEPRKAITPMPGFRFIGGDSKNTDASKGIGQFYCFPSASIRLQTIPTDCGGYGFQQRMNLGAGCWDGRRFGPGLGGEGIEPRALVTTCAPGLRLPYIILAINWPPEAVGGRLASDDPLAPAGSSSHGDFVFGWTFNSQGQDALARVMGMCLNDGPHDLGGTTTGNCVNQPISAGATRLVRVSDGATVTD